jgi:ABC-2 type transport system ATP-binding protein
MTHLMARGEAETGAGPLNLLLGDHGETRVRLDGLPGVRFWLGSPEMATDPRQRAGKRGEDVTGNRAHRAGIAARGSVRRGTAFEIRRTNACRSCLTPQGTGRILLVPLFMSKKPSPAPPESQPPIVVAEGLSRRFHGRTVVDGLDFELKRGEILGFLGPNGAGKTTTMRMLTGYLPPTAGRVLVAGHDVATEPVEARRRIGYMPENVPLYTDMRVKEYLQFRAELKGMTGKAMRARVGEVMDRCGLTDARRRMIGNLSKGYRQRIGLADAIVHEPDLLILDEPTNGFDPNQILQVRELIRELAGKHTILLSTHILAEVEQICDRVIIIDEGKIKAMDTPAALADGMRTAAQIRLEVRAPSAEAVCDCLRAVDGVRVAHLDEVLPDGWFAIGVKAESTGDTRVSIVSAVLAKGWKLREIHRAPPRLEEVFLEVTHRQSR